MKTAIPEFSAGTFTPMLTMLSTILDKGAEHMRAQGKNPDALMEAKLAPDMFPLPFQIEFACQQVRVFLDVATGKKAPEFASTGPKTLGDLKAIIDKTLAAIKGAPASALEGAEDRKIEMPLQDPIYIEANGAQVLRDWILPNFYFHVVTAYDILRSQGVELGKRDFLMTSLTPHIRQRS